MSSFSKIFPNRVLIQFNRHGERILSSYLPSKRGCVHCCPRSGSDRSERLTKTSWLLVICLNSPLVSNFLLHRDCRRRIICCEQTQMELIQQAADSFHRVLTSVKSERLIFLRRGDACGRRGNHLNFASVIQM